MNLAQRYHDEITLQPLMAQASTIALLQPPPSRCLASYADSDWVLKQKLREEHGLKLNRHQRKNRFKLVNTDVEYHSDEVTSSKYPGKMQKNAASKAIIASGTGPDGRAEERKLRKRRKMVARSVAVVLLSVFAAMAKTYFSSSPSLDELSEMPKMLSEVKKVSTGKSKLTIPEISDDNDKTCQAETCSNEEKSRAILSEKQHLAGSVAEDADPERPKLMSSEKTEDSSGEDENEGTLCSNDEVSCFFVHQV